MTTCPPESFSWVAPDVLAAMAWPQNVRRTLEFLKDADIGVIVSLTETPLNSALVEEFGFEYHHLPVRDFTAPSQAQVRRFIAIVKAARRAGKKVVVHCMAGRGRTGTMAACYLVSLGRDADEALREIRALRPGSVETREQEQVVRRFAARQRRRRS